MCSDSTRSDSPVSDPNLTSLSLGARTFSLPDSTLKKNKHLNVSFARVNTIPDSKPNSSQLSQNQSQVSPSNSPTTTSAPATPRPFRPYETRASHFSPNIASAANASLTNSMPATPHFSPNQGSPAHHSVKISGTRPMGQFGQCEECKSTRTGYNWCQYCDIERCQNNFVNWTSGCKEIDDFIQVAQLKAINVRSVVEWIDYEEFTSVKHLANGGNSSVFTAYWPRGPIRAWDTNINDWERGWGQANSDVIILKRIKNSNKVTTDFLKELGAYHQFSTLVSHVVRCYGISRCPTTKEFIVVTSYAEDGDLRQYLSKNFDNFTLLQKIITLRDIASGLVTIHRAGLLHKDLHTGNILRSGSWTMISDLGLCWNNASVAGSEETVCGVLPYVAPEVLRGMPYTRAADVYSVGMIMYELWSGRPPFEEKDYDVSLAVEICSGARPEIASDIPDYYSIIMQACWAEDSNMRPTSRDLERTFDSWIESIANRVCPKLTLSTKRSVILTIKPSSSSSSQPIPPLPADQHEYLKKLDKRREVLYDRCLDDRLIEMAEQKSRNQEQVNPMTWTRELKTLADEIFGSSVNNLPFNIKPPEPEPTRPADDDPPVRHDRSSK
ncbi:9427_t:CDS:2 [Paraglomus brasilianum]|uniref:9427_t:CDS:1 n=1 Tax=Paraglomus brasilianum TaxID=144538 RepID=A0A9N9G5J2_9GLOM|nr:9427_t:CDS:2 [Paraglomus brasilianum]